MDFQSTESKDIVIIKILTRRATVTTADPLREHILHLIEKGTRKIVVDLDDVDFIDSTFLGALLAGMKRLVILDGEIRLSSKNPHIAEILKITRLNRIFSAYTSVNEAKESFNTK